MEQQDTIQNKQGEEGIVYHTISGGPETLAESKQKETVNNTASSVVTLSNNVVQIVGESVENPVIQQNAERQMFFTQEARKVLKPVLVWILFLGYVPYLSLFILLWALFSLLVVFFKGVYNFFTGKGLKLLRDFFIFLVIIVLVGYGTCASSLLLMSNALAFAIMVSLLITLGYIVNKRM